MKTKTLLTFFASALIALTAVSCNPEAKSHSGTKVTIDIEITRVSAGFVEATFTPSKSAYFLTSVEKVDPDVDLDENAQVIMDLALDSCYVNFITWRHQHLVQLEDDIADFPSHALNYGTTTRIQNYLEPDTDYWVYCFVVDANSNKANGNLYWTTIHTTAESIYTTIRFGYRVIGDWDYVYPYNTESENLVTDVPWVGQTVDSLDIVSQGYASPGHYFDAEFKKFNNNNNDTNLGVYVHQNKGVADSFAKSGLQVGHTYYTGLATLDGKRNECYDIYKFTWEGQDTSLDFDDEDNTMGAW